MGTKERVSEAVAGMPENCTWDEVEYRLWVMRLLEQRAAEADHPDAVFYTQAEVER